MAAGSAAQFLFLSGRLVKDPTDLSAASPYGGTVLGSSKDLVFAFGQGGHVVEAEEFGGQRVEFVRAAENAALSAVLRGYDTAALAAIFPNTATGEVSQEVVVFGRAFGTSVVRSGALGSDLALTLLFEPDDRANHPFILVHNAIPRLQEAAELQLELGREGGFPVLFQGVPETSGRIYQIGRLEDLAL